MAKIEGPFVKQDQLDSKPLLDGNNPENKMLKLKKNQEIDGGVINGSNSKKSNEFSTPDWNNKGSIAERRAAKCGFNASKMDMSATTATVGPPVVRCLRSPCVTIPPGISPAALLDSPVMLPNAQAQLSPTTGTFQFPPCNLESLLKFNNKSKAQNELDLVSNRLTTGNKPPDNFENPSHLLDAETELLDADCHSSQSNVTNTESDDKESGPGRNLGKDPKAAKFSKNSEDGYNWRKYGQKHVKGSEFPRSYFKCTNTNCPVKKKVERSHDGQVTEIVYKGSHNHPKPQPSNRCDLQGTSEGHGSYLRVENWRNIVPGCRDMRYGSDSRPDGLNRTSDFSYPPFLSKSMNFFEPVGTSPEFSSTFACQDGDIDEDEATLDSTSFNDHDDDNDESEPKRRKKDSFPTETNTSSRSAREPRVVIQIESDIDILDDGYRWRKYGQKVVKGNPNPRSYYKCTTPGCPVRKHVERAADNLKSVITTYEGKHNHEVPSSKTGSLVISSVANLPPAVTNGTQSDSLSLPQNPGMSKAGMQVQDLPLYLERKPILSNEYTSSDFLGNLVSEMNFGASSIYQFASAPLHSIPYGSLLMSSNDMDTYHSSNIYPMVPDYVPMPFPMNHLPGSGNVHLGNFHFGNHMVPNGANIQTLNQGQPIRECHTKILKPKEEQKDNNSDFYEACLSVSDHANATS